MSHYPYAVSYGPASPVIQGTKKATVSYTSDGEVSELREVLQSFVTSCQSQPDMAEAATSAADEVEKNLLSAMKTMVLLLDFKRTGEYIEVTHDTLATWLKCISLAMEGMTSVLGEGSPSTKDISFIVVKIAACFGTGQAKGMDILDWVLTIGRALGNYERNLSGVTRPINTEKMPPRWPGDWGIVDLDARSGAIAK